MLKRVLQVDDEPDVNMASRRILGENVGYLDD